MPRIGRPTKLSPRTAYVVIRAIRMGAYVETAVAHAGLSKDTYYRWMKLGADYLAELRKEPGSEDAPGQGYGRFAQALEDRAAWERKAAERREQEAKATATAPPGQALLPLEPLPPEPQDYVTLQPGACLAFSDAVEKALADAELRDLQRVDGAAERGSWQAAAWRLERRNPTRWARRTKVDLLPEGEGGEEVNVSLTVKRPIAPGAMAPGQKEEPAA